MDDNYDYFLKIILLGFRRYGRSSFLCRYTDLAFEEANQTQNYDFVRIIKKITTKKVQGKVLKLQIWDITTMERFRSIRRTYFKATHGFVIIIDLTDSDSFNGATYWKNEIDRYFLDKTPAIILIGNKADLESERFFTFEEAKKHADSLDMLYIEASAKTNFNVEKALEILLRKILNNFRAFA